MGFKITKRLTVLGTTPNSGYPEDLETFGTPDTVDITDILSVDVTPLTSISISGMDVTSCPDMSVGKSMSVDLGTSMSVDFDGRSREIQNISSASTFADDTPGAYYFQNTSLYLRRTMRSV